jgi:hypothetical protein
MARKMMLDIAQRVFQLWVEMSWNNPNRPVARKLLTATVIPIFVVALTFCGCATDPMVTGLPQHWKGKPATDLKAAMGEPNRIVQQSSGAEVWEYIRSEQVMIPKGENTSLAFGLAGGGNSFGGAGGFSSEKRPEDRTSNVENLRRFKIEKGKVTSWYAARIVDGRVVWEDH